MIGDILIKHAEGWACSNDAKMIVAHNIGQAISIDNYKRSEVLNQNSYFEIKGVYEAKGKLKSERIECLFKSGKAKFLFDGLITDRKEGAIIVRIIGEIKDFVNKTIEKWLEV